jgi:DNA-binding protein Fis
MPYVKPDAVVEQMVQAGTAKSRLGVNGRPIPPRLPVDVVKPTAIARAPDSKGSDVEKIMATALRSLADYLLVEHPGKVYREIIAIVEPPLLAHVLALTDGNQYRAAHLLGLKEGKAATH